ncbi:MAG: sulfite reductase (NADPH) hemoprotein beta-component [Gallionellaceae bacterium]|nr:MAG: sulfite reductase (NADPH) hemoprotein beta-component [Gallionellaceae bacterium]
MYHYDDFDHQLTAERVAQFRDQVRRRLSGELKEDDFRVLRLQNGIYMQVHGYMMRIAIPYGLASSAQVHKLAHIARTYDRGYGHLSTRQNIQFNWLRLEDTPEILAELATVEMHANQTSGSCIRSITSDELAGVARDELTDPRPFAEILRQWSTFHPEFAFLPRKFKVSVSGASEDRAATEINDVGVQVLKNAQGDLGFRILVGGGLGRTPIIGQELVAFLPWQHLLTYLEAIVRVYNEFGRRDNLYKARIKILVQAIGINEFRRQVEAEWQLHKDGPSTLTAAEVVRVTAAFSTPAYEILPQLDASFEAAQRDDKAFANWVRRNVTAHKVDGYAAVWLSLKHPSQAPGDISADQLDVVAALADHYSFGELRFSHLQNLVLADVKQSELYALWQEAKAAGLATPNIGLLTDIVCCPGADFCTLANARSISLAKAINERFEDYDYLHDIGDIDLNISGCVNACGHHHVAHIGILGVDKSGEEWYQVTIGGNKGTPAAIGKIIGRSFSFAQIPEVISRLLQVYVRERDEGERFIDTLRRIGHEPFKTFVYAEQVAEEAKLLLPDYEALQVGVPYELPYFSPRF